MNSRLEHNRASSRYEIYVDGTLAGIADYARRGNSLVFHHTEVDPRLRGRGLAAELVRFALDDVRSAGGVVMPTCWYVERFIDEHPEYQDVLAA